MGGVDVVSRAYMVKVLEPKRARESLLLCEVERSRLELKRINLWSYCGYPAEIEDISADIDDKMRDELVGTPRS